MDNSQVYDTIARSLRDFGYRDVTAQMVRETDEAHAAGAADVEPHGIISLFANKQLAEARGDA